MCRFLYVLSFFVLLSPWLLSSALAFDLADIESSGFSVGIGYRTDQFNWGISAVTALEQPDIISELSWDDLEIVQLHLHTWFKSEELPLINKNAFAIANIAFGKIVAGQVQDSDYAADNRSDEWSRSVSDADDGLTVDLSAALGPIFECNALSGVSITPLVGYAFNVQALTMTNGQQVISKPELRPEGSSYPAAIGPLMGLDSTYTAYWYGPWLGANIAYHANDQFKVIFGIEYHWVEYFAQADWNLRSDFMHPVSFEHESRGTGVVYDLQGEYVINEKWSWVFNGNIQNWNADSGCDTTYLADGSVGKARLNQVEWDSYALTTGLQYLF
ncbi:hypothetical protein SAMN05660420_03286 [Desulfuromusa kysingii]|uniref:Protochlamydia outer membrane protein domain-containing protein n=1 Tax=Desulfuromusa kysingii TaxID=37625 RepID=A0A1H4E9N4_9BACT|nr:hypothetical protein [Desulfuromusa kysingii]SEA81755.1 hypothetical protein SAMN05660420_03286 [Desulfuromusa kysingii]